MSDTLDYALSSLRRAPTGWPRRGDRSPRRDTFALPESGLMERAVETGASVPVGKWAHPDPAPRAYPADTPPRTASSAGGSLRPFFGYYGGKWRDAVKHYPAPRYGTIVEPFAGSAGYALRYASSRVVLCELDPIIYGIWDYLIRVEAHEILAIPDIPQAGTVDDLKGLPQEARWLVGFWMNRGTASPRKGPSKWMRDGIRPGSFWGERVRTTIASQVDQIRHWQVFNRSYEDCPVPAESATWFVDAPYQRAGEHYTFGSKRLDFDALGRWCQERRGQVIVCENEGATWLPFTPLADIKTTRRDKRSREVVWSNAEPPEDEAARPGEGPAGRT